VNFTHVFGFRVMVEPVPEHQGLVIRPEKTRLNYQLGRVVAVGDGRQARVESAEPSLVAVGDLVWLQTNDQIMQTQSYVLGERAFLNLHRAIFARFGCRTLSSICGGLGRWSSSSRSRRPGGLSRRRRRGAVSPFQIIERFRGDDF
jgi:co-chaperonin GroES (HSP10)